MTENDNDLFLQTGEVIDLEATVTHTEEPPVGQCAELIGLYDGLLLAKRHSWTTHLRLIKEIGRGGQGVVYLTRRRGSDDFTLPVAIKVFSPERYPSPRD